MGNLWELVQEYLDSQGGMAAAALARKIGTRGQTVNSWKIRGSRPEPTILRKLARAINVDYEVVLAAAEADAGYRTDDELAAVMRERNIPPETQERLRRHASTPITERRTGRRKMT